LPGGTYTHWKAPPFHGAHPDQTSEHQVCCNAQLASSASTSMPISKPWTWL